MPTSPVHARELDVASDLVAAAAVLNAASRRFRGRDRLTTDDLRSRVEGPGRAPGDAAVAERDGRVVGFADIQAMAPYATIYGFAAVAPDVGEPDAVRDVLVAGAEHTAGRFAAREPGVASALRIWVYGDDADMAAHLDRRGYRLVRHTLEMVRDLDDLEAPPPPPGVRLVPYRPERDVAAVHEALEEAFLDHEGDTAQTLDEFRHMFETSPRYRPDLCLVAVDDTGVVGASINEDAPVEHPDTGLVAVIGVRAAARKRGIGEHLLRASFAAFAADGKHQAVLYCDADNLTGAVRLYTRVGMRIQHRDDIWEKPL